MTEEEMCGKKFLFGDYSCLREPHEKGYGLHRNTRSARTATVMWGDNECAPEPEGEPTLPAEDTERLAATRVQNTLHISRADAFRLLRAAKVPARNWGQTADAVILEIAGPGLPEPGGDAMNNYRTWDASDGNFMVINGVRYTVINSDVTSGPDHTGRLAWEVVTEGEEQYAEEQPVTPADATATRPVRPARTIEPHPSGGLFIRGEEI